MLFIRGERRDMIYHNMLAHVGHPLWPSSKCSAADFTVKQNMQIRPKCTKMYVNMFRRTSQAKVQKQDRYIIESQLQASTTVYGSL